MGYPRKITPAPQNGLSAATYANPIVTDFVVNGTFDDSDISMWSCNNSFQNRDRKTTDDNNAGNMNNSKPWWENWNGSALVNKMYQTIYNIPNGTYRLDITAFVNNFDAGSQYVFANNDQTPLTGDATTGATYEVYTVVTNNQIEIGLEQTTATANWMGIDNVSLSYFGAGNVIIAAQNPSLKSAWDEAKAAAEAAVANSDYTNVTGSELTALNAEIAKAEPNTAQGYVDAAADLVTATNAFIAAKTNYDLYAAHRSDYMPYADPSKSPAITSETTATSILNDLRAWIESNALAEGVAAAVNMTSSIVNSDAMSGTNGWTRNTMNENRNDQPWTSINTPDVWYFDGGTWGASSWSASMAQTVSLPAGRYLLTAKARGAVELATYTMSVGGYSADIPHVGSSGNVFDNGWGDVYLEFYSLGYPLEINVSATSVTQYTWFSIDDFRLIQLEFNSDAYASTASDYSDLNTAIGNAELKTIGFETGEYAPYINAVALKALAEAKAMNQNALNTNLKSTISSLTEDMNEVSNWTANTEEVNAVNTALFTSGSVTGTGWTQTQSWGQCKEGVYSTVSGTFTYGELDGYTMPLKANTVYKLTFNHRAWDGDSSNPENGGTVSVLCGEDGLPATSFTGQGTNTTPKTETFYFKTGVAGNYVFTLAAPSGRPTFGGVTIMKAVAEPTTISEDIDYTPAETYADVTLTRTIKGNGTWNTFVVPFDITNDELKAAFGNDVEVAEFSDAGESADAVTIEFNTMTTPAITANTPVLLKGNAGTGFTFTGKLIKTGEAKVAGTYLDFVGSYDASTTIAGGDFYIGSNKLYKSNGSATIKGTRAYLHAKSAGVKAISFIIDDDDPTGIEAIDNGQATLDGRRESQQTTEDAIYNVAGQRMSKMQKGINIVNGKKVLF